MEYEFMNYDDLNLLNIQDIVNLFATYITNSYSN